MPSSCSPRTFLALPLGKGRGDGGTSLRIREREWSGACRNLPPREGAWGEGANLAISVSPTQARHAPSAAARLFLCPFRATESFRRPISRGAAPGLLVSACQAARPPEGLSPGQRRQRPGRSLHPPSSILHPPHSEFHIHLSAFSAQLTIREANHHTPGTSRYRTRAAYSL